MEYAVYADLSRPLTVEERSSLFEALDSIVPNSGFVGRDRAPNDEVYFCIEADNEDEAIAQAAQYMSKMLEKAALDVTYKLTYIAANSRYLMCGYFL
jgi:hypothetical protein